MLKYLLLLISSSAFALPVGNPWEVTLSNQADFINCDFCFDKFCWNNCSFRVGFYGDYVFNRHLEVHESNHSADIDRTALTTNAGIVAINFCNRLDLFATVGASNFYLQTPASAFALHFTGTEARTLDVIARSNFTSFDQNGLMGITTDTSISWSVGLKGVIWKCGNCLFGAETQYFSTKPDIKRVDLPPISQNIGGTVLITLEDIVFTREAPSTIYPSSGKFSYQEWQLGLSLAQNICISPTISVIPYAAADFSMAWVNMKNLIISTIAPSAPSGLDITVTNGPQAYQATLFDLRQQHSIGFTIGLGLIGCDRFSANVEWRYITESAFYTNFQLRF